MNSAVFTRLVFITLLQMSKLESELIIFVNDRKIVDKPNPHESLVAFLRKHGLTGTKIGCHEGGCGSCTVAVFNGTELKTLNSCMTTACAMHYKHVITIEGLGNQKRMNVVQSELLKTHSSQCGYCTPGIVMSLWTELQKGEPELDDCFDGNLCRCTGYRAIWDGSKALLKMKQEHCMKICGDTEKNCELKDIEDFGARAELSLPIELKTYYAENKHGHSYLFKKNDLIWANPLEMQELLALMKQYPSARIICGNTEVSIEQRFKNQISTVFINPSAIEEMTMFQIRNDGVSFGGAITINGFRNHLIQIIKTRPVSLNLP